MRIPRISNAMGQIDDDLITAAESSKRSRKKIWIVAGSLAACLVLICTLPFVFLASLGAKSPGPEGSAPQNDVTLITQEIAIVWPWEYKTIDEKYVTIDIDGQPYTGRRRTVDPARIGEVIGIYTATGYEDTDEGIYHQDFEVFHICNVSAEYAVAVLMENNYYVFFTENYAPPATLGEVLEQCSLEETVTLSHFSVNNRNAQQQYYTLNSAEYIWTVLEECKDAAFTDPTYWVAHDRDYLSFTVTSEALGAYKQALYVTADGYIWTNMFYGAYLYYIGTEAAQSIIGYATENAVLSEYEPYQNTVAGIVSEITDEYILIEDSVLNPQNERTYKVLLNSKRISRYVELKLVAVGDVVVVSYEGTIDTDNGNVLSQAMTLQKAFLSGANLLIPE